MICTFFQAIFLVRYNSIQKKACTAQGHHTPPLKKNTKHEIVDANQWKLAAAQNLGGANGLLPLTHQNRAVRESFGKSEIPGPKHFCDLCRKVPRHGNSDHFMFFKERAFCAYLFCDLCQSCAGTEIISEAPF